MRRKVVGRFYRYVADNHVSREFFSRAKTRIVGYGEQIRNLHDEMALIEHQAANRSELYASIAEDVRGRGAVSVLDRDLGEFAANMEKLAPALTALQGLEK